MTNTPSPYDLDALGDDPMYRGNPQYKELYSTHRLVCRQRDGLQARVAALEGENARLRAVCELVEAMAVQIDEHAAGWWRCRHCGRESLRYKPETIAHHEDCLVFQLRAALDGDKGD